MAKSNTRLLAPVFLTLYLVSGIRAFAQMTSGDYQMQQFSGSDGRWHARYIHTGSYGAAFPYLSSAQTLSITGDVTGTGALAGGTITATLPGSGVVSGTYGSGTSTGVFVVNGKGQVTGAVNTPIAFSQASGSSTVSATANSLGAGAIASTATGTTGTNNTQAVTSSVWWAIWNYIRGVAQTISGAWTFSSNIVAQGSNNTMPNQSMPASSSVATRSTGDSRWADWNALAMGESGTQGVGYWELMSHLGNGAPHPIMIQVMGNGGNGARQAGTYIITNYEYNNGNSATITELNNWGYGMWDAFRWRNDGTSQGSLDIHLTDTGTVGGGLYMRVYQIAGPSFFTEPVITGTFNPNTSGQYISDLPVSSGTFVFFVGANSPWGGSGPLYVGGSDNTMPNQTLTGTGSILNRKLGDARYAPAVTGTATAPSNTSTPAAWELEILPSGTYKRALYQ